MESILIKYTKILIIFISGCYITSLVFLQLHSNFEDRLFNRISSRVIGSLNESDLKTKNHHLLSYLENKKECFSDIDKLLMINEFTHTILGPPRKLLFLPESEAAKGFVDKYLHSSVISLLGGYACYMHSQVFGRIVDSLGFEYRNFAMRKNFKTHHVAEVKVNKKWIVFDPLFNQTFKDKDGNYLGKEDVRNNWNNLNVQLLNKCRYERSDYDYSMDYDYTPANNKPAFTKNLVYAIWAKLLNYGSSEKLNNKLLLNRYLKMQIYMTNLYIIFLITFLILILYVNKKILRKVKNYLKIKLFFLYKYIIIVKTYFRYRNERKVTSGKKINFNNMQSILFFTTHKAASSFFANFFKDISQYSGLVNLNYDSFFAGNQLDVLKASSHNDFINKAYPLNGAIIGPMRAYREIPELSSFKIFLLLRDPRDVLTSFYFSAAFSHGVLSKGTIQNRLESSNMSIDEFVRKKSSMIKSRLEQYVHLLDHDNLLFIKYEDMMNNPSEFLSEVERFIGFNLPPKRFEQIVNFELCPQKSENKYSHRRSGKSMDYKLKLKAETIDFLNIEFNDILVAFEYEI